MIKVFNFLNNKNNIVSNFNDRSYIASFPYTGTNLKPLEKDCVSFTSRVKKPKSNSHDEQEPTLTNRTCESKKMSSKGRTISASLANRVVEQAEYDTSRLRSVLKKTMLPLIQKNNIPCTPEKPIYQIEYRTKTANSIREKASQKFLYTKESVIRNLHDLVGARIIIGNDENGAVDKVIDKLIQSVNESKLKIIEVENHMPPDKKYQYVSQTKLRQLAHASADRYGIIVPERITHDETAYTAIHLLVEFPDGITGEIQIIGKNVATFKELEDIPYKILQGKSVDSKYSAIIEALKPLMSVGANPLSKKNVEIAKLRKEFSAYTTAAYKHEREKRFTLPSKAYPMPTFLTLYEFSKIYKGNLNLPPELDFNNLYKLKVSADYKK